MEDKWLPIDSAPKDGTTVLIFHDDFPCIARYIGRGWESPESGFGYDNPTHWQPLPQPPKR